MKSRALARISTRAPKQNNKNLGHLNFSITNPIGIVYCWSYPLYYLSL